MSVQYDVVTTFPGSTSFGNGTNAETVSGTNEEERHMGLKAEWYCLFKYMPIPFSLPEEVVAMHILPKCHLR